MTPPDPIASPDPRIVIAGAGSIGCFVGGLLAAAGRQVTLLARQRVMDEITENGLVLTDFAGLSCRVPATALTLTDDPGCLSTADVILVTVKSGATGDMAALIGANAGASAPVVSLQNGLDGFEILASALPGRDVRAGMVAFNVVPKGAGCFHRAISGDILIGSGPAPLTDLLSAPGLVVSETAEITAVQWGKLLLNLNNALNALSGLTILEQMMQRDWRSLMADQMAEALRVLRAAHIPVTSTTPVPPGLIPWVLRLPTPLFRRIAAQMLTVDPSARASMSYDLTQNRPTEIASLQGRISALGTQTGVATPICDQVARLVREAETRQQGAPGLAAKAVRGGF